MARKSNKKLMLDEEFLVIKPKESNKSSEPKEPKADKQAIDINKPVEFETQKINHYGKEKAKVRGCLFFYIRMYNSEIEFWHIGSSVNTIDKTFGSEKAFKAKYNLNREIIFVEETNLYDAFFKTESVLFKNKDKRTTIDYNNFSNSACFLEDIAIEIDEDIYKFLEGKC